MNVIIFGSNGMLGTYMTKFLSKYHKVVPLTRNEIDLSNLDEFFLLRELKRIIKKDDIVINACGVIKQREYNVEEMIKVNSVFPHLLAKIKEQVGCQVIHITTDCVYNGEKGNYNETDLHDCLDDYGKSKSLGENTKLTTIRTSIIGEELNNKKSLLEWVRSNKGKTIDGYDNHLWNGVTCLELAKIVHNIISEELWWEGVRHVFSPTALSKYELVSLINEIYGLGITVNKKNTPNKCFRNLSTIYFPFIIKSLKKQILELKNFKL